MSRPSAPGFESRSFSPTAPPPEPAALAEAAPLPPELPSNDEYNQALDALVGFVASHGSRRLPESDVTELSRLAEAAADVLGRAGVAVPVVDISHVERHHGPARIPVAANIYDTLAIVGGGSSDAWLTAMKSLRRGEHPEVTARRLLQERQAAANSALAGLLSASIVGVAELRKWAADGVAYLRDAVSLERSGDPTTNSKAAADLARVAIRHVFTQDVNGALLTGVAVQDYDEHVIVDTYASCARFLWQVAKRCDSVQAEQATPAEAEEVQKRLK